MSILHPEYNYFTRETTKLNNLASHMGALELIHQKLVAEILVLRLFDLLINLLGSVAEKIGSGASYLDGSRPLLLTTPGRSRLHAIKLFQVYGRGGKPRQNLRWSVPIEISKNVIHVIAPNDNFCLSINKYSNTIDDLRKIRNRIAHNNSKARERYRQVIMNHYGANLNNITPGTLLLTDRWSPCCLSQYLLSSTMLAKELVKK